MRVLDENSVAIKDYKYIQLYKEYEELRLMKKEKYDYTLFLLSQKYGLSRSTIRRIILRFEKDV